MTLELTTDFKQLFDGVINLITAVGVFSYIVIMTFSENKNGLQKRLIFLLTLIGTLCLTRGLTYMLVLDFSAQLEKFVLMISALIPFSLFLLVELLLRRHFPLFLKLYALFSSLGLIFTYIVFKISPPLVILLMINYVIMMTIFATMLFTRSRKDLIPEENKLLDTIFFISVCIIPLIVSDFKTMLNWDTIRLGAFGILFFIYTLINIWDSKSFASNLLGTSGLIFLNLASSLLIAFVFNLLPLFWYVFVITVMLRMVIRILTAAIENYSRRSQEIILPILEAFSDPQLSWDQIKERVRLSDLILVSKKDLQNYRPEKIAEYFNQSGMYFQNEIQAQAAKKKIDQDVIDEIRHLYEDFDCNACLFISFKNKSNSEFFLLLLKWPSLAPKSRLKKEIQIISHLCSQIKGY